MKKYYLRYLLYGIAGIALFGLLVLLMRTPSNDRAWSPDQALLPYAEFSGDSVTIYNIRDLHYRSADEYDLNYYDQTLDLSKISSVDFSVIPFGEWTGPAHTFLSFGFDTGEYVAISVEIRKEMGETFSALKGLFRNYELMYVVASERDLLGVRAVHREDDVYLYPIDAPHEKIREVFVDMLTRANELREKPEFYNTLTSTCTTNIARHINTIADNTHIPLTYKVLLPAYSDKLAFDLGLIDTDTSFQKTRERSYISKQVREYIESDMFSRKIRALD